MVGKQPVKDTQAEVDTLAVISEGKLAAEDGDKLAVVDADILPVVNNLGKLTDQDVVGKVFG